MNRKALIDALRIGGSMSGKSKAIAILDYAKIVIKGNVLKITSSDTECCIAHKMLMANSVEGEHTFVANPRDLSNALKSLKGDEVTVWIDDSCLELKHAKGTMAIPTMSAEEFPLPTLENDCTVVEFDSESLFRLLNRGKEFISLPQSSWWKTASGCRFSQMPLASSTSQSAMASISSCISSGYS